MTDREHYLYWEWVAFACKRAHPDVPTGYTGCLLPQGHYGPCRHEKQWNTCKHAGGWYPCLGVNGEHCNCPVRDQDPGDEQPNPAHEDWRRW